MVNAAWESVLSYEFVNFGSGGTYTVEFGQGHAKFTGEPAALADFSGDGNAIATADFQ